MSEPLPLDILSCAARLAEPPSCYDELDRRMDLLSVMGVILDSHEVTMSQPDYNGTPVPIITLNGKQVTLSPQFECRAGDRICIVRRGEA